MSDYIFPTLRGLTYPIYKTPHWNTIQNKTITGQKRFLQLYTYPYYTFKLQFSYLSDEDNDSDDIHSLMSFYNKVGGAGQDFLFADPLFEDNTATAQAFAVGDGTSTEYQLIRHYGDFAEPVYGILAAPTITKTVGNTTTTLTAGTDFTWSTKGLITFKAAPASGAIFKWSGTWYYRCHFTADEAEFQLLFYRGWGLDEIELESIKLE